MDGGSNRILFPVGWEGITNFVSSPNVAYQADGESTLVVHGEAKYGIFDVLIADVQRPIISEPILLLPPYNLIIHKDGVSMYIYARDPFCLVATATLQEHDGLHHPDSIDDFRLYQPKSVSVSASRVAPARASDATRLSDSLFIQGSQRHVNKATRGELSPLEILHVILNHAPEALIKRIVRNRLVRGLKFTWDQIRHLSLRLCDTCLRSRMRAFPVYPSISSTVYGIMECVSADIVDYSRVPSVHGYRYAALFICRKSKKKFPYPLRLKTDFLDAFIHLLDFHGAPGNKQSVRTRFLNADSGSEELDSRLQLLCKQRCILLHLAPPKKPQYDYIESHVGAVKRGTRAALLYHIAPLSLWFHAMRYCCWTQDRLPSATNDVPPVTQFNGTVADMSHCVPFYSDGYYNVTTEEKKSKVFSDNAVPCRMIGYADNLLGEDSPQLRNDSPPGIVSYKQSYICLTANGAILIRHDCYFSIYQDNAGPNLLRAHPDERISIRKEIPNYDLISDDHLADVSTPSQSESSTPEDTSPAAAADDTSGGLPTPTDALVSARPAPATVDERIVMPYHQETSPYDQPSLSIDDVRRLGIRTRAARPTDQPYLQLSSVQLPLWHPLSNFAVRCATIEANAARYLRYLDLHLPTIDDIIDAVPEHDNWVSHVPLANTPNTSQEALQGPDSTYWRASIIREAQGVISRDSWLRIPLPEQTLHLNKAVRSKFVFKVKKDDAGLYRFKSRLTPKGFTQIKGVNYDETYAATARFESICIVLSLAAIFDWPLRGIDVENAFCEGILDDNIYMVLPENLFRNDDGSPIVVKLLRAMYGLKQAAYVFQCIVRTLLESTILKSLIHDVCVFVGINETTNQIIIVVLWVDDVLLTGNYTSEMDRLYELFVERFTRVTTEGEVTRYIGIDIARDRLNKSMTLSQEPYQQRLIDKYLPPNAKTKPNPVNPNNDYRALGNHDLDDIYEQAGELGYIADRVSPHIQFPVNQLRSAASNPTPAHEKALKHIYRFLADDPKSGITFNRGNTDEVTLFGYADGSTIRYGDSRGQLAFCLFLNLFSGTICARSVKSKQISLAPSQTELQALILLVKKILWARGFLRELGFPQHEATVVYTDSSTVLDQLKSEKLPATIDHIVLALNFLRQEVIKGTIELRHIDTEHNVADIGTKNLAAEPFQRLAKVLLHGHEGITPVSNKRPNVTVRNPLVKMFAQKRKEQRKANSSVRFIVDTHDDDEDE
jgi:hypothetical protein